MAAPYDVQVYCGRDYAQAPVSGTNLMPADALTNAGKWIIGGFGYDNTQPAPVPEAQGMRIAWTTDPDKSAFQGVNFAAVAGKSYTLSVTVSAASGAAQWRTTVGWTKSGPWQSANGLEKTSTIQFTAAETKTYTLGIETFGPTVSTHLVTAIGVWDQSDTTAIWEPARLNNCDVALPLTIYHGRSGVTMQPDAPTCSFTYLGSTPPGEVGDIIQVGRPSADQATWVDDRVSWMDAEFTWLGYRDLVPKFNGSIVALTANESGGVVESWDVQCVGRQAALGRIPLLMVRPVETDIERIQAIAAEVGYNLNVVGTSDLLLAADTINRNAQDAIWQICESAGGMIWQGRSGDLWYGAANHREQPVTNVLDCELILDGVEWSNDHENIVNSVTVGWGVESASTEVDAVFNYRTTAPTGDPGSGNMAFANGSFAFSRWTLDGFDMAPVMRQLPNGSLIYMQEKSNADNFGRFTVIGEVVDNGAWFSGTLSVVEYGGSGLGNNADVAVRFGATFKQERTYDDDDSLARWGLRHITIDTIVYSETQAGQLALLVIGRRAQPYWRMPGVIADYSDTTANQAARLDALEVSEGVTIPVEVNPSPTPGDATEWTVEGWVEEWASDGHFLQVSLSDRRRTGAVGLRNWAEMRDAGDWNYWTGRKWIDALVKGVGE